ncbi:hypothetical protein HOD24_01490, partial [Candidatus Peregrinibacteria bacterium]|nr:hypothetical protein [Candidatus Peregrinibacteria bacterium]
MIKRVNSQADYLAELLELIEGVDEELLTSDEKGEIIKEVSESGISVELRPRLAEIFSAQEKLLEEEITDLTAIESSIGKEIEGPLT